MEINTFLGQLNAIQHYWSLQLYSENCHKLMLQMHTSTSLHSEFSRMQLFVRKTLSLDKVKGSHLIKVWVRNWDTVHVKTCKKKQLKKNPNSEFVVLLTTRKKNCHITCFYFPTLCNLISTDNNTKKKFSILSDHRSIAVALPLYIWYHWKALDVLCIVQKKLMQ